MTTAAAEKQLDVNNAKNEEEKRSCRLCHGTDEDEDAELAGLDQEWVHPCKCSGSIKWVHRGCFGIWRGQVYDQQRDQCSICSHVFRFSPRLKPRWYTKLPTQRWLLILLYFLAVLWLLCYIAIFDFLGCFRYALAFCQFLVLIRAEYRLQLELLELENHRAHLVDEQSLKLVMRLMDITKDSKSLFEESIQDAAI